MSWLPATVTVNPTDEPITLIEAKAYARIEVNDDDELVESLITAARAHVESITGLKLATQTALLQCSSWADLALLPVAPVSAIEEITYLDENGDEQTLSTDVYEAVLVGLTPSIRLKVDQVWPTILSASNAIRVEAVAGFVDIPPELTIAVKRLVATYYDNRTTGVDDPVVNALLVNHRIY